MSSDSDASDSTPVAKRPKYAAKPKVFCNKWLEMDEFKGWLKPVPTDKYKLKCDCCNKIITCGKTQLKRHAESKIHLQNAKKLKQNQKLDEFIKSNESERRKAIEHQRNVQSLELGIATYFVEHNIALQNVDHFVELLKYKVPDSKIIADLEMKRTKCTGLITNVLAKVETNNLIKILQTVSTTYKSH
jgi:hypothetical protein